MNKKILAIAFSTCLAGLASAEARYDWRHTDRFGFSSGTITGFGLSYRHWGEATGLQITGGALGNDDRSPVNAYSLGGAALFSLDEEPASVANRLGFTGTHFYWFVAGMHAGDGLGGEDDFYGGDEYITTMSAGVGLDLLRRASNWSVLLGLGPYLVSGQDYEGKKILSFEFYPTIEASFHFGVPNKG